MRIRIVHTGLTLLLALAPVAYGARPFRGGVVAAPHAAASEAALEMLNKGGNAVDAAVAAAFTLAVVQPFHSGIGGGGFALTYDAKTHHADALDFREVAPKGARADMFVRDGKAVPELSLDGGLAVGVPGAVRGYLELLAKHGKLSPQIVLAPAIRLARKGFWVSPMYQRIAHERVACLRQNEAAAKIFLRPNAEGQPDVPAIGAVLTQPELAATLSQIAAHGAKAFYEGKVASAIATSDQQAGGVLTVEDLASYRTRDHQPLEGSYRGHRVLTMPPPSAGGIALVQTLQAMEQLMPKPMEVHDPRWVHTFAEVLRRVYAVRMNELGDPAFVNVPLAKLTSREFVAELVRGIDPAHATPSSSLMSEKPEGTPDGGANKHTSHISVIDRDGNAVALTTTVNYYFGSCVVAKGTGVLLNDQMDDFTSKPGTANVYGLVMGEKNAVAPGKVPLSSMTPTLVFQSEHPDEVMMAIGSPGGSTIPTTVMQTLMNVVDLKMNIARAVGAGRVHHQFMPDAIWMDQDALEPATVQALEARGHQIKRVPIWGDAEAVMVDPATGLRYGASDPRNEGYAMGQD